MAASVSKSEASYIQAALHKQAFRADGRALTQYRTVHLETGVAPLANGSARVSIGRNPYEGGGGTEAIAATKLELADPSDASTDPPILCSVLCAPTSHPHLAPTALDELQHDLTTTLAHALAAVPPPPTPWRLALDVLLTADAGNAHDAVLLAARAALADTRVPRTRAVRPAAAGGLDTRARTDFELVDGWDEGEPLAGRGAWPVCVTLNLDSPVLFLDATAEEERAVPVRVLVMFSFPPEGEPMLRSVRVLGPGELRLAEVKRYITEGQTHAKELWDALDAKLRDEDVRRNQKARDKFAKRQ